MLNQGLAAPIAQPFTLKSHAPPRISAFQLVDTMLEAMAAAASAIEAMDAEEAEDKSPITKKECAAAAGEAPAQPTTNDGGGVQEQ